MSSMTLTCCVCNEPMQSSRSSKPQGEAAHNRCRRSTVVAHGEGGYRKGCRCDVCKTANNERMRRYGERRRERDGVGHTAQLRRKRRGVDPLAVVECVRCAKPIKNIRDGVGRPMHKSCRAGAEWMRRSEIGPRQKAALAKLEKASLGTTGGNRIFTCGGCRWCAEQFVGIGVYCSKKCATAAKFSRRSSGQSFNVSPRERIKIYERDAWICQLCQNPVDPSLRHPHIWSASLDHIIPQSAMLIPDHSPSNLRLAHMWCNSARGDGSNMTEIEFHQRVESHFMEVAA